jgi:hypothetical protein
MRAGLFSLIQNVSLNLTRYCHFGIFGVGKRKIRVEVYGFCVKATAPRLPISGTALDLTPPEYIEIG